MSYLKPLATAFLSTLFTMQMPFNATPPAHAQENDCVIYALAGAARMRRQRVLEVTDLMDGPALNDRDVEEGLRRLGLGTESARTFATREELERYLHSHGNAEFIVGWSPSTRGAGIGHVVNARVTDGSIRYIDHQNNCRSPDPAAEPPRNEANAAIIYYAWDTSVNVQGMEDLTLLMGGLSLNDRNSSLVRRSESAGVPLRNPSFGNFTASCRNINLNTDFSRTSQYSLSAECENAQGNLQEGTAILLGGYITNNNAALSWQSGGGFGGSVRNCSIDVSVYTVLTCDAKDRRGSWRKAAINLDVQIENKDGRLGGMWD